VTETTRSASYASARLAAYATAAAADDPFDLEALIERAAATPASRRRDMELGALLGRLAELDPRHAAETGQALRLETHFLVPIFKAWAAVDADAAIDELRNVIEPAALRTLALAVLETLGNDTRNAERVASVLPQGDRLAFTIDAVGELAKRDPSGALTAVLAFENELARSLAVRRVAEAAAGLDPHAALAAADGIADVALRTAFKSAVLDGWAKGDPSAVLAYLEAAPPSEIPSSTAVFTAIAASDPERLLAMLDRLPQAFRTVAQRTALQALAERNPQLALAQLETLPPGQDRNNALQAVAQAYGRQNPEAALAWAKAQMPPTREAMSGVMRGIAEVDFDLALDLVLVELESTSASGAAALANASLTSSLMLPLISSASLGRGTQNFARTADRLVAIDNPQVRSMLSTTLSVWSQTDSAAALHWAVANADRIDGSAVSSL
jgi:hypothetical protein